MTKILITGGSGFIGTNIIDRLVVDEPDCMLLNIDKLKPRNTLHQAYWREVDILDYNLLKETIEKFNPVIIIHLAAVTDLNGKDLKYYDANITGTENVIRIAAELPLLKKVIYTSSMYVCKPGFIPKDYDTYLPHTVYGESKVKTEQLVKSIRNPSYSWTIIRPTSIWGAWFKEPYIDFFNIVYRKRYFDFGKACTKTYGYIENTVFQILKLLDSENVHGKSFYLGDLPATQISEWANEISLGMGLGKIRKVPYFILKAVAKTGDLLIKLNIKFPLTSFRLNNMTTNNIIPLDDIYSIAGQVPYSRIEGINRTLLWMSKFGNFKFKTNYEGTR